MNCRSPIALLILFVGLYAGAPGCAGTGPAPAPAPRPEPYPAWFLETPGGGDAFVVVGYSRRYANLETSLEEARSSAALNLARGTRMRIAGEHAFESVVRGVAYRGSNIREFVDSTLVADLRSELALLDSVVTNGMVLVLTGPGDLTVSGELIESRPTPQWTEQPPTVPGYDHAIGSCVAYYYATSSWEEAERQARIQLAFSKVSQLESLARMTNRTSHDVTVEGTDVTLAEYRVVARYHDVDEGAYYVLARCRSGAGASDIDSHPSFPLPHSGGSTP